MSVSIKDIARRAGVSHSTVSRALTDSPLVNVKTKARIQALAREMGYTPNTIARAMSTRRTQTIGLVVTSIADPFVSEVVRGIEETAQDLDYSVILCNSTGDPDREVSAVQALRAKWVDAVIVTSSRVGSFYAELSEIHVPVVLINNQQAGAYSYSVRNDDHYGGQLAAEYLLSIGHRHIAYVTGPEHAMSSALRLQGCQQILQRAGIEIPQMWIWSGNGLPESGHSAVRHLLHCQRKPTALFCYNDMTAIGTLRALKEHGLRIPDDISILGYDDIPTAPYFDPPLTTIAQAKYTLGQMAMQMTRDLIRQETEIHDIVVRPQLVIRGSCAPPRTQDIVQSIG
jgi:DNA-binding LacI/PurR family transcriptional regulator